MSAMRKLVVPAYLLACLLLGGSTQSAGFNAALQLAGLAILAWSFAAQPRRGLPPAARRLGWLCLALTGLVALHLLPLPVGVWSRLPGHQDVLSGLARLGLRPGWQSLSLAPYDTIASALPLIVPMAVLAAMFRRRAYTPGGIAVALLLGTLIGLGLGVLQIGSPADARGNFYLQRVHADGSLSGFFANPNHMATLLLIAIPFLVALVEAGLSRARQGRHGWILAGIAGGVTLLAGLFLNHSLAGLALLIPVLAACGMAVAARSAGRRRIIAGAAVLVIGLFVALIASPSGRQFVDRGAGTSFSTRREFLATSLAAADDYLPLGSGIGTFERVYRIKEDPATIDASVSVNHAHDDYVEVLVEAGLPGVLLVLLFLAWWGSAVAAMLRSPASDLTARAGAIGSAAVLLHSLVDFPLRNSAIAASFAVCLGLIVLSRKSTRGPNDLRPTRHLELG